MINIFLDDLRKCPNGFILARNYQECINLLTQNQVSILSLDHDLGSEYEPTGYDVCKYIIEHDLFPKSVYLHTSNPVGRMNMYQLLERYKPASMKLFMYPYK